MIRNVITEYPRLTICLDENGRDPVVRACSFQGEAGSPANTKLLECNQGKYILGFCIFLLVVKYLRRSAEESIEPLRINEIAFRKSWLNDLGESYSQESTRAKLSVAFNSMEFFHIIRSKKTGELPAKAHYYPKVLHLRNLELSKLVANGKKRKPTLLEDEGLIEMARKLEDAFNSKIAEEPGGEAQKWVPSVDEIVDAFAASPQSRKVKNDFPHVVSSQCRELFSRVNREAREHLRGGTWYVITGTPIWLNEWRELFCEAAEKHNATIKCAFNSGEVIEQCPSVGIQWKFHTGHGRITDPVSHLKIRRQELRDQLNEWATAAGSRSIARKKILQRQFEFYESSIAHPYIGVMSVPPARKSKPHNISVAPKGTWCALALDTFFFSDFDDRCAISLDGRSDMLNLYYKSIVSFFDTRINPSIKRMKL